MSQNVPPGKNLELAMLLASGVTATAAAEQIGVCRKTVQRRLAKPAFRRLVSKLRDELMREAVGRMAASMTRAANALDELLATKDEAVRLRAARAVLSLGSRLRDSVEVSERLTEVERELASKQGVLP